MPWGEQTFNALQRGEINGLMVNIDSGADIKAQNKASNILTSKNLWLGHVYLLVINKGAWAKLTTDDKEAIQRATEIAYQKLGSLMDASFAAMVMEMKSDGANIRILKPEEIEAWQTAVKYKDVQDAWTKKQEADGTSEAGVVLEKLRSLIQEFIK